MTSGYNKTEIAKQLGRPASWVSEHLSRLHDELLLTSGLFFPLAENEYQALLASIERHGVRAPIILGEHVTLIDGRHRLLASTELELTDIPAVYLDGMSPEEERELAIGLNAARRQLTAKQKRTIIETELMRDPARSDRLIASICGVSHPTVASVRQDIAAAQRAATVTEAFTVELHTEEQETTITLSAGEPLPIEGAQRTTATGATRSVTPPPEREAPAPKMLGYAACAHGQMHTIYRHDDGYRLEPEEDR